MRWQHFAITDYQRFINLCYGVVKVLLASGLWTLLVYVPYTLYMLSYSRAAGFEHPSMASEYLLTFIIVIGNQIMYLVCDNIARTVGHKYHDHEESTYIVLYFFIVLLNVGLDVWINYKLAYVQLVQEKARDSNGFKLADMKSTDRIMESYPMQKVLGELLMWYAFPTCFLIPFILEPLMTVWLPYYVNYCLVRSRPDVKGIATERSLQFFLPMDLGRYADICINLTIACTIFMFPPGFWAPVFGALLFSHIWVYLYDHYRVLRATPLSGVKFASRSPDRCATLMFTIPCGVLVSIYVFKLGFTRRRVKGWALLGQTATAFVLSVAVQGFILHYLVPRLAQHEHKQVKLQYADVAKQSPCTYLSTNPIHCLRSQYLHKRKPHCMYYVAGKEHLLEANPKIGVFFGVTPEQKDTSGPPEGPSRQHSSADVPNQEVASFPVYS